MFEPEQVQERLRQKPFRPLRIIASEGQRFDIRHPDLVLVGDQDLTIGIPRQQESSIYHRVIRVALSHVVAMEDLPVAVPHQTNGSP